MAKLEIPISKDYVPTWGTWEAIREAVQNGLDENERGFPLKVSHRNGTLNIFNQGADISSQALILGKTNKRGSELRGQHGEGLTLSLLTAARNKIDIKVLTQTEIWTPSLGWSDNYQDHILLVKTRKLRQNRDGVEVQIKIDKNIWKKTKNLFMDFSSLSDKDIIKCERGSLILNPEYKGQIFSKGIYVMTEKAFSYGYNLKHANLDRDRSMIRDFDLKWETSRILKEAVARKPEIFEKVYSLLEEDSKEIEYVNNALGGDNSFQDKIAEQFKKQHGEEAVPVRSIQESANLAHIGKKGILVNDSLKKVLASSTQIENSDKLQLEVETSTSHIYNWDELEEEEQKILLRSAKKINKIGNLDILNHTLIVDFYKERFLGRAKEGKISIAKKVLKDKKETLKVLLHEEAHLRSSAGDGDKAFIDELQNLWTKVYFANIES
jgi:hypothetical protein